MSAVSERALFPSRGADSAANSAAVTGVVDLQYLTPRAGHVLAVNGIYSGPFKGQSIIMILTIFWRISIINQKLVAILKLVQNVGMTL